MVTYLIARCGQCDKVIVRIEWRHGKGWLFACEQHGIMNMDSVKIKEENIIKGQQWIIYRDKTKI